MKLLYREPIENKKINCIENESAIIDLQGSEFNDPCFNESLNSAYDILFEEVILNKNLWKSQDK